MHAAKRRVILYTVYIVRCEYMEAAQNAASGVLP